MEENPSLCNCIIYSVVQTIKMYWFGTKGSHYGTEERNPNPVVVESTGFVALSGFRTAIVLWMIYAGASIHIIKVIKQVHLAEDLIAEN